MSIFSYFSPKKQTEEEMHQAFEQVSKDENKYLKIGKRGVVVTDNKSHASSGYSIYKHSKKLIENGRLSLESAERLDGYINNIVSKSPKRSRIMQFFSRILPRLFMMTDEKMKESYRETLKGYEETTLKSRIDHVKREAERLLSAVPGKLTVKLSRKEYPSLKHSYTVLKDENTRDLRVFRHLHTHKDKEIGKGGVKRAVKVANVSLETGRVEEKMSVLAKFQKNKRITPERIDHAKRMHQQLKAIDGVATGHHISHENAKGEIWNGFLMPRHDDDLFNAIGDEGLKISANQQKKILLDISSSVKKMHEKGIAHMDIKPTNIFVDYTKNDNGTTDIKPYVADVEDAYDQEAIDQLQDRERVYFGTPQFMAPEVAQRKLVKGNDNSEELLDGAKKADVYSLAVLALDLVKFKGKGRVQLKNTLKKAFQYNKEGWEGRAERCLNAVRNLLDEQNPFDKLMLDALEHDPTKRPTVQEFHDRLNAIDPNELKPIKLN